MAQDYTKWDKDKLIEELRKLHKNKAYGLVWEDKPEIFEKESQNALPVLKEKGGKFTDIKSDDTGNYNILIEGDNYHALSVLQYTHRGKIDVIYIDPPYNTGNKSWKYNNNYVEKDDVFLHSKWLSFMSKRLVLAKRLLKEGGSLVCAIDKNEQSHLTVLLEEIFSNFDRHVVTVLHNPKGVQGDNFSYTHEYATFVIPKSKRSIVGRKLEKDEIYISNLRNWGGESLRSDAKNCFYPIVIRNGKIRGFGDVAKDDYHPKKANEKKKNGDIYVWPIDGKNIERKWRYARQSVKGVLQDLIIDQGNMRIQVLIAKPYGTHKTVWFDKKYDASEYGTKLIKKILPKCDFDFPKSLYTVEDCIGAIIHDKNDAVILDFFAGSGTTGHAVLELNKDDGGNRKFILCTNNENKICEEVTYRRVKRVIKGYKTPKGESIEGLGDNLKYLKTDFVKIDKATDNLKQKMVDRSTEVLCLKEGTFDVVDDKYNNHRYRIVENSNQYTAILFDLFYFDDFVERIKKLKDKRVALYVFSYVRDFPKEEFGDLDIDFTVEAIPEKILETYKKIFNF